MGTNYYHRRVLCEHCGNASERHIGKSSAGWTFMFQGTEQIRSYTDWLAVLEAGGEIRDEYGRVVPLDDFKAMVAAKRAARHNYALEYPTRSYLDPEGHSFSDHDFS